jgi:hypothetical protein
MSSAVLSAAVMNLRAHAETRKNPNGGGGIIQTVNRITDNCFGATSKIIQNCKKNIFFF